MVNTKIVNKNSVIASSGATKQSRLTTDDLLQLTTILDWLRRAPLRFGCFSPAGFAMTRIFQLKNVNGKYENCK
jgi:hypothetical protein